MSWHTVEPNEHSDVATREEWRALYAVNEHFTYREKKAFLNGYRIAKLMSEHWTCTRDEETEFEYLGAIAEARDVLGRA